ncbi:MAG: hypothetical protein ACK5YR_01905 [Pirellula sp.]|jgi:hypothetical protein
MSQSDWERRFHRMVDALDQAHDDVARSEDSNMVFSYWPIDS